MRNRCQIQRVLFFRCRSDRGSSSRNPSIYECLISFSWGFRGPLRGPLSRALEADDSFQNGWVEHACKHHSRTLHASIPPSMYMHIYMCTCSRRHGRYICAYIYLYNYIKRYYSIPATAIISIINDAGGGMLECQNAGMLECQNARLPDCKNAYYSL